MTTGRVVPADAHPETARRFDELATALALVTDPATMAKALTDLCTPAELDAMGQRLQVARLVAEGIAYQEISRRTGASTATVTRVAQWLRRNEGGYAALLSAGGAS
jgi:TrpR-related protein YerC/YecD